MDLFSFASGILDDIRAVVFCKVAKSKKHPQTVALNSHSDAGLAMTVLSFPCSTAGRGGTGWIISPFGKFLVCLSVACIELSLFAQPAATSSSAAGIPASAPVSTSSAQGLGGLGTDSPLHSVPPSSLLESRLHPAALPTEAELSCSVLFGCQMGLTRGFSFGGDAYRTLGMTLLGQHLYGAGAWTYLDVNVGYQFLRLADRQSTLMGAFGFRTFSYENSERAKLSRSGPAFRTAYAESVLPAYTQGLVFEAFSSVVRTAGGADQPFNKTDDKNVRTLVREYAQFLRANPLLRLQMPADLEIMNWSPSQVDLPAPIRGYLRINPIYEQADLAIRDGEVTVYSWFERRFALQLMLLASYASPEQKSGRLGLLGGMGFEMGATRSTVESKSPSTALNPEIPEARLLRGKLEIQVTYQF